MAKQTKVFLLDLGTLAMPESALFWGAWGAEHIRFPVYGVLIDHADGLFLFDTGFDKALMDGIIPGSAQQTEEQTLPARIALAGYSLDRVSHVINSHYHIDHVGGNKLCRHATTVCHKCELEAAANPEPFEEGAYADMSFAPGLRGADASDYARDVYTPRVETVTGDADVAKGVRLIETPGHTDGHCSLLVTLADRRPMLFTGDACYSERTLVRRQISTSHVDPRQSFRSLDRIDEIARDTDAELFYAHDADAWRGWKPAPAFYS